MNCYTNETKKFQSKKIRRAVKKFAEQSYIDLKNVVLYIIKLYKLHKIYNLLSSFIPGCHQANTTCHLMCEQRSNSDLSACSIHNELKHHKEYILDLLPAKHKKLTVHK